MQRSKATSFTSYSGFVSALGLSLTLALTLSLTLCLASTAAFAQTTDAVDDTQIDAQLVADGIYMITGRGGNMGLSIGDEATFLIDDQFAPLTDKIIAAVTAITERPVDYVLNTHWHGDHTGGNENFGKQGALIMAHDNVRTRLEKGRRNDSGNVELPAKEALPVVTFNDALTLHVNNQTIRGVHVHHAHTDGDVIVHFREGNVIHMGDTFFNQRYPWVDLNSGGHIDGVIRAAEAALSMADENTKIIPGHGPLANKADLQAHYDRVLAIRATVARMMDEGMSLDEIQAAKPTSEFDGDVDAAASISPERMVGLVYNSLSQ